MKSCSRTLACLILLSFIVRLNANNYLSIHSNGITGELLGDPHTYACGSNTVLTCRYRDDKAIGVRVQWIIYNGADEPQFLTYRSVNNYNLQDMLDLTVTIRSSGRYACEYISSSGRPNLETVANVTVTIQGSVSNGCQDTSPHVTTTTNVPVATTTNVPVAMTTTSSAHASSTPTGSSERSHFTGLNPLIYTTVAAVLLGILVLVAIVTCWLRSRKMSPQRTLLPQETPQDYLDYIREGQFTPLTTSEFIASLSERPPTYNESQDIQRRLGEDEGDTPSPPPLPSRPPPPPPRQGPSATTGASAMPTQSNEDDVEGVPNVFSSLLETSTEHSAPSLIATPISGDSPPPQVNESHPIDENDDDWFLNDDSVPLIEGVVPS